MVAQRPMWSASWAFLARALRPLGPGLDAAQVILVLVAVIAPGVVLSSLFNLWTGLVAFTGSAALLFLIAGVAMQRELESGPNLVFIDPHRGQVRDKDGVACASVSVSVANVPTRPAAGVEARRVWADIAFFRVDGERLFGFEGKWSDRAERERDFAPNALSIGLDIAVKPSDSTCAYGYNERANAADQCRPSGRELTDTRHYVEVVLIGANALTLPTWFCLERDSLALQLVPRPPWRL